MARIVVVGEAWGSEEAEAQAPFVGPSGKLLYGLLAQAGIPKQDCYFTNVFNLQPQGSFPLNDLKNLCGSKAEGISGFPAISSGKFVRAEFAGELTRLYKEIVNECPTIILALGATAAWALAGTTGIRKIRGAPGVISGPALQAVGKDIKLFPTYHPAAVLREWTLRPIVIADLIKAERESRFPELIRPKREIWIEPTLVDLDTFEHDYIRRGDSLSVDIETVGDQITCVGFAPSVDRAIVVPFHNPVARDGNYWPSHADELKAWEFVRRWCYMTVPPAHRTRWFDLPYLRGVGQNFLYDMHRLWRSMGIIAHNEDDTMLLHHSLQPEMEKGLGFLATIYTEELPWKFMRPKHETLKKED
jgi:uracil-DNA glycosylase